MSLVDNMRDPTVGKMYSAMEAVLHVRLGSVTSMVEVLPIFITLQFTVDAGIKNLWGFFYDMHRLMSAQGRMQDWERVWTICRRHVLYTKLVQKMGML